METIIDSSRMIKATGKKEKARPSQGHNELIPNLRLYILAHLF